MCNLCKMYHVERTCATCARCTMWKEQYLDYVERTIPWVWLFSLPNTLAMRNGLSSLTVISRFLAFRHHNRLNKTILGVTSHSGFTFQDESVLACLLLQKNPDTVENLFIVKNLNRSYVLCLSLFIVKKLNRSYVIALCLQWRQTRTNDRITNKNLFLIKTLFHLKMMFKYTRQYRF